MASRGAEHTTKRPDRALARLRRLAILTAVWSTIALAFAAQGWWAAVTRGAPQSWWPPLGYSAAIFSIWLLLTEPIMAAVGRVERMMLAPWRRVAIYLAGFPVVTACHVGLFSLFFWPLYNDGGRIASPLAMAERMLVLNAHTNLIFYADLVLVAARGAAFARRRLQVPAGTDRPTPSSLPVERLRIRSRGVIRDLALEEIDWIGAVGNYAEIHSASGDHLIEGSLTALAQRLPSTQFARIHRQTIIRTALVRELRSQGRDDALVRLADGTELRLSRRYRAALSPWRERA